MTLVLLVAALAATAVALSGGAQHLVRLHLRGLRLLLAAAALQLAPGLVVPAPGSTRTVLGLLSIILVALFLVANAAVPGVALMGLGLIANVAVILANGAMPVSVSAAERVGISRHRLELEQDPLREPLTRNTRLSVLGDVVPVAVPWHPQVVSPGDVLVASGVGLMIVAGPRRRHGVARASAGSRSDAGAQASERAERSMA